MKKTITIILLTITAICSKAQNLAVPELKLISRNDTLTNEFLDTLNINKKLHLNDYSMIGFQYGVSLSQMSWNPRQKQEMLFIPVNFGVTYTKYGKMFGYMPYFGIQVGLFYAREGYRFKYNEETEYTYKIQGAESAVMEVVELPVLSHLHIDFWKAKIIAQVGFFGGYRLSIHRFPGITGKVKPEIENSFLDTDRRWDYGIKAGLGFGLVFDPFEIHIQAMYKHSWSSIYQPDHYSQYYYRFAYPSNIIISAGLHFHLSRRTGMTRQELKKTAKEMVYENNTSTGR